MDIGNRYKIFANSRFIKFQKIQVCAQVIKQSSADTHYFKEKSPQNCALCLNLKCTQCETFKKYKNKSNKSRNLDFQSFPNTQRDTTEGSIDLNKENDG